MFSFYQQTALHIAARDGQERTVQCIFKGEPDIGIKDNNGVSYMHTTEDRWVK